MYIQASKECCDYGARLQTIEGEKESIIVQMKIYQISKILRFYQQEVQ